MAILTRILLKSTVLLLNAEAKKEILHGNPGCSLGRQPLKNVERFCSMNASKIAPLFRDSAAPFDAFKISRQIRIVSLPRIGSNSKPRASFEDQRPGSFSISGVEQLDRVYDVDLDPLQ